MTEINARLMRRGIALDSGATLDVDPDGLDVLISFPGDTSVIAAKCTITTAGDNEYTPIDQHSCSVTTSHGPGYTSAPVTWVTVDWRTRRVLAEITLSVEGPVPAGVEGHLKLAEAGPWYGPTPSILPLGHKFQLPGLTAQRLMIEFFRRDGDKLLPVAVPIKHVALTTFAYPPDLALSVGEQPPFAQHPRVFRPGEQWEVEQPLREALHRALHAHQNIDDTTVYLHMKSSAPGKLANIRLELVTSRQLSTWKSGRANATLNLEPDVAQGVEVPLPKAAQWESLSCCVASQLAQEASLPTNASGVSTVSHRCRPGVLVGQELAAVPVGARVCGLDLHLRPLTAVINMHLQIYRDRFGLPSTEPVQGEPIVLKSQESSAPPWPARWVSFTCNNTEIPVGEPWWIVMKVVEGDILWSLDPVASDDRETPRVYYRNSGDPWHECRLPPEQAGRPKRAAGARARVRVEAETTPEVKYSVLVAEQQLPVVPNDAGQIFVGADRFQQPLTLPLRIYAHAPIRAVIHYSNLRVSLTREATTFRFPRE